MGYYEIAAMQRRLTASTSARQAIEGQLHHLQQLILERFMPIVDDLEAKLASLELADDRMIALLSTIHNELVDARASGDTARLDAAIASMSTEQQKIIDAMNANPDPAAVTAAATGTPTPETPAP